jgi:hypothetical protein
MSAGNSKMHSAVPTGFRKPRSLILARGCHRGTAVRALVLVLVARRDVVIAPAGIPHSFTGDRPGWSKLVCTHANPTIVGE